MLLSDGEEWNPPSTPYIRDTYDEIEAAGVIIDTIAISDSADQQMEDLAKMTSGITAFCPDSGSGTCVKQAMQGTFTQRPDVACQAAPVQVHTFPFLTNFFD